MDYMTAQDIMREQAETYCMDHARCKAPDHCKDCDHLWYNTEDERFYAPPRYPGDRTIFGDIRIGSWCNELDDECPEDINGCPIKGGDK